MANNYYVAANVFDWARGGSRKMRLLSRLLKLVGSGIYLRATGSTGQMTNIEQRMNLYHLLLRSAANPSIPGDVIELGTYMGETAVMLQWALDTEAVDRPLHVYDSFEKTWGGEDPLAELKANFEKHCGTQPVIHAGRFDKTLPDELPEAICFAHIDCGYGGPEDELADTVNFLLQQIYPRMHAGAICVLMDYSHPQLDRDKNNLNSGAQVGTDRFLDDKPEKPVSLYAENYCHAYFVRQ